MKHGILSALVGVCALGSTGCTYLSFGFSGRMPRPFETVQHYHETNMISFEEFPWFIPYVMLDMPPSLALDALWLPLHAVSGLAELTRAAIPKRQIPPPPWAE